MTGIPDEAVDAYLDGEAGCDGVSRAGRAAVHDSCCCTRAGLAAALPYLAATIRADVAEEIATAISVAFEPAGPIDVTIAYSHAAHLAWQLRVPDCGDQYHGADGGPCSGCGFDAAADVQDPAPGPAPTQSHQPTPERRPTAATGALNDVPQQNPNPTHATQED